MAKIIQQSAQHPHTPDGRFVQSLKSSLKFCTKWSVAMCSRLNLASLQLCSDPPNVLREAAGFCFNTESSDDEVASPFAVFVHEDRMAIKLLNASCPVLQGKRRYLAKWPWQDDHLKTLSKSPNFLGFHSGFPQAALP